MRLHDYQDVASARDCASLERSLLRFAHDLGFGIISGAYVIEQPAGEVRAHHFGNTPKSFLPTFRNRSVGRRDPVLRRLKRHSTPFIYDQSMYVSEGAGDLWEVQAPFGYKTGIAMALHLPGGTHFLMGVDRDEPLPSDGLVLTRTVADLQLLAVHAQLAATQVFATEVHAPEHAAPSTLLSPRELEVLQWTLDGKTAWEVGAILGIAQGTAEGYVNSASRKLGAVNKHQAALKALRLGWIHLS